MEEILELKELIKKRDYDGAMKIVEEMEEMSKKDIINNIRSYAVILLLHLIKREVENRTTSSWDDSIDFSILEIQALNRRQEGKGNYLNREELKELMEQDAFRLAIIKARREVFKGVLAPKEIAARVDKDTLINKALDMIASDIDS